MEIEASLSRKVKQLPVSHREAKALRKVWTVFRNHHPFQEPHLQRNQPSEDSLVAFREHLSGFKISSIKDLEMADEAFSILSFKSTDIYLMLNIRLKIKAFLRSHDLSKVIPDYYFRYHHPFASGLEIYRQNYSKSLKQSSTLESYLNEYEIINPVLFAKCLPLGLFKLPGKVLQLLEFLHREWISITTLLSHCSSNDNNISLIEYKSKIVS